jgi:hypothetical protein
VQGEVDEEVDEEVDMVREGGRRWRGGREEARVLLFFHRTWCNKQGMTHTYKNISGFCILSNIKVKTQVKKHVKKNDRTSVGYSLHTQLCIIYSHGHGLTYTSVKLVSLHDSTLVAPWTPCFQFHPDNLKRGAVLHKATNSREQSRSKLSHLHAPRV